MLVKGRLSLLDEKTKNKYEREAEALSKLNENLMLPDAAIENQMNSIIVTEDQPIDSSDNSIYMLFINNLLYIYYFSSFLFLLFIV